MRVLASVLLAAGLAACAAQPVADGRPPAPGPTYVAPVLAPPSPATPATPPPVTTPPAPDQCGIGALGDLVGKPRTEIPVPVDLTRRRVVCEGCPVTQDLRPDRQTIFYDQATGRVTRLVCG